MFQVQNIPTDAGVMILRYKIELQTTRTRKFGRFLFEIFVNVPKRFLKTIPASTEVRITRIYTFFYCGRREFECD